MLLFPTYTRLPVCLCKDNLVMANFRILQKTCHTEDSLIRAWGVWTLFLGDCLVLHFLMRDKKVWLLLLILLRRMKIVLSEKWRGSPCVCIAPGPMHILVLFGSLCTWVSCVDLWKQEWDLCLFFKPKRRIQHVRNLWKTIKQWSKKPELGVVMENFN